MQPHSTAGIEKRFLLSIGLTAAILVAEVIGGLWTGSLALLSDAAHVFMDIFALGLSFIALRLSALPADDRHTFGYHRLEVLAALTNGITLGAIAVGIFSEAWQRWQSPGDIKSSQMLVIAAIGLVVNLIVAWVLGGHDHQAGEHNHAHKDLNVHSAFLHVLGDAISSVGVILAAIVIGATGWMWLDPLMSVVIGVLILFSSVRVLRSSLHILIEGVPEGLSLKEISRAVTNVAGVSEVHDLHVWSLCSGHTALSAHVTVQDQSLLDSNGVMAEIKRSLLDDFHIEHTTIQFECAACGQIHPYEGARG